ncbi:MAG: hypothetical protein Ct9H300mP28_06960 [Pseudomonadota bacterium]|nr:MAG: hypothetical protein Ct9H300mP28_06960 [Pseudomonadota bacterium]
MILDVLCLGEPLLEFNQIKEGNKKTYSSGYGGDTSNTAISIARQGMSSDLLAKLAKISSVGNYWNCGSVKKWITLMSPYIQKPPQEFILLHMMLTVITLPITEVGQRHVK